MHLIQKGIGPDGYFNRKKWEIGLFQGLKELKSIV